MEINELRKVFTCRAPSSPEEQKRLYAYLRLNGVEPGEIYQGVEMSSAYVNTHHDTSYSNAMMNLHSHLFYEIICCTNTCDVEYLVGTERYRLQKGDIIFVAPGVSHKAILPERMPVPYERDVLWLSERFAELMKEMLPAGEQNLRMGTQLLRTAGTRWEAIPELFRRGVLEFEKGEAGAELAIAGNTMTIVASLIRASLDPTTAPLRAEKPELLDQVMAYVEEHLGEKITLGDIARQFFASESTVSHVFRQKMGVSFYRCVTQRRLIAAKTGIRAGEGLENVSRAVGFSDYSSFYRAFKREYGISPRQFERMKQI